MLRRLWRAFPSVVVGGAIVVTAFALSFLAPLIGGWDPLRTDLRSVLQAPSLMHPLGTDDLGRDILSRTLHGGRVSLPTGVLAVAIAMVCGSLIGLVGGYVGGWIDAAVMRLMDALIAIPSLLLAIGITAVMGPKLANVVIAISLVYVPAFARIIRGQVLSITNQDFILAARSIGVGRTRMLFIHVLPNALTPIIVLASLRLSSAILTEASLSFLGLSAQPPTPSWGSMINAGRRYLETAPWVALAPGIAIFASVLGLSILGDGVRDLLDPRRRSRAQFAASGAGRELGHDTR